MDDYDTAELITLLCTRIGMIMEDLSVAALTIGGGSPETMKSTIDDLERGAGQISTLIGAARALLD